MDKRKLSTRSTSASPAKNLRKKDAPPARTGTRTGSPRRAKQKTSYYSAGRVARISTPPKATSSSKKRKVSNLSPQQESRRRLKGTPEKEEIDLVDDSVSLETTDESSVEKLLIDDREFDNTYDDSDDDDKKPPAQDTSSNINVALFTQMKHSHEKSLVTHNPREGLRVSAPCFTTKIVQQVFIRPDWQERCKVIGKY